VSARVRVDLSALRANLRLIRDTVAPAQHMLVVKDDAYGHGVRAVVDAARAEGVRWVGAFDVDTARAVREVVGADARIFVWLLAGPADLAAAIDLDLDLGIGDRALLDEAAALTRPAERVHLKIDTGLHRNGIRPEEWADAVAAAAAHEAAGRLRVDGLWTHLAEASDDEDDAARGVFTAAAHTAAAAGLRPAFRHVAASAASFARPEFRDDLVRVGAFAYGIRPAGGPDEDALGLRPVGSLVAEVRELDGAHAVLDLGSLDGLPSALAGVISVRTPGGVRRVIRIEPTRALVEAWPGAVAGEEITVLGARALHGYTDAAERIGTIGEEIATRLSPLLPREYVGE